MTIDHFEREKVLKLLGVQHYQGKGERQLISSFFFFLTFFLRFLQGGGIQHKKGQMIQENAGNDISERLINHKI